MRKNPTKFMSALKLTAVFTTAALVSACNPAEPARVDTTQEQGVQTGLKEYQVLMIRNGCEVGRGVEIDANGARYLSITSICPPPGAEVAKDMMGPNVKYKALYKKFGCEIGNLNGATITLCPASGESSVKYTESYGKGQTREVVTEQRRPKQPEATSPTPNVGKQGPS